MGYVADESGAGVVKTRGRTRYLTSEETRLLDGLPEGVKLIPFGRWPGTPPHNPATDGGSPSIPCNERLGPLPVLDLPARCRVLGTPEEPSCSLGLDGRSPWTLATLGGAPKLAWQHHAGTRRNLARAAARYPPVG